MAESYHPASAADRAAVRTIPGVIASHPPIAFVPAAVGGVPGSRDRRDPRITPLFGDVAGLPPVLVHVGEDEVLLDDARRSAARCAAAGAAAECHVWQGMAHVFPSNVGVLEAAGAALDHAGAFLREHLAARRRPGAAV
ncbi:hypothetical protein tb265_42930 [Gemmatimonadetes bacterium T265]|nr:hypothetical protein tb265_42930 [Gemmatimonadetes bacterium T265]